MVRRSILWWHATWFLTTFLLATGIVWRAGALRQGIVWLLAWGVAASVVTAGFFGMDKWFAQRGTPRVPERTLWLASLAGGSPGAWLGMRLFRHKTAKRSFRSVFGMILAMQAILGAIVVAMIVRGEILTTRP